MSTIKKNPSDPLQAAANVYNLVMENEQVRVLDARFSPGAQALMHFHPNHVVYVFNNGTIKITNPDGKSVNVDLKAGQAIWMPAGQHAAENVGKAEAHNLVIEIKK
jgi:mannose-6-phosphate isomerase-like protein (cupin superfamily)